MQHVAQASSHEIICCGPRMYHVATGTSSGLAIPERTQVRVKQARTLCVTVNATLACLILASSAKVQFVPRRMAVRANTTPAWPPVVHSIAAGQCALSNY